MDSHLLTSRPNRAAPPGLAPITHIPPPGICLLLAGAATPSFDVRIEGLGVRAMVSQIANTALKDPKVGSNIPTVARVTQVRSRLSPRKEH